MIADMPDMPDSAALQDFINMQCFKYSSLGYAFLPVFNFLCCVKSTQCVTGIKYQELFCTNYKCYWEQNCNAKYMY